MVIWNTAQNAEKRRRGDAGLIDESLMENKLTSSISSAPLCLPISALKPLKIKKRKWHHILLKNCISFVNQAPLNDTHNELKVNFLEYWEISKEGKILYHNTWITDLEITELNVYKIARGGRARWHIENEIFNTLKNQGYHFEHNFGHGYKNLSTVFAMLMMLAFLIDQTEQLCCGLFQGALKQSRSKKTYLWRTIRELFVAQIVPSWEVLYLAIINTNSREIPVLNSS